MRAVVPVLLILALATGCGSEGEDADYQWTTGDSPTPETPETGVLRADDEASAASQDPVLLGRAEALQQARARRKLADMAGVQSNERVRGLFTRGELSILEGADEVRLVVGNLEELEAPAGASDDWEPGADVERQGERQELAYRLLRSVAGSDGSGARCFTPHHTVRFCKAGQCVEVSVCLGCRRLSVYSREAQERHGTMDFSLASTLRGLCRKYGLDNEGGC